MNVPAVKTALVAGGSVSAIIPHTIEEVYRIAQMVHLAGLAPKSLTGDKDGDTAKSAIATAILFGAELGLPPMASLRSIAVVNGRPALYADGLISVCRRSGRAAYIRTGYDAEREIGWCEAKRSDTGEESRVEFSLQQARHAKLLVDSEYVQDRSGRKVANNSPWFLYRERMAKWRATGWCLRDLFADILGGAISADELEDTPVGEVIEHQPQPQLFTPPPEPEPEAKHEWPKIENPADHPEMMEHLYRAEEFDEVDWLWSQAQMDDWNEDMMAVAHEAYQSAKARIREALK
jgi:hypothetical protein